MKHSPKSNDLWKYFLGSLFAGDLKTEIDVKYGYARAVFILDGI